MIMSLGGILLIDPKASSDGLVRSLSVVMPVYNEVDTIERVVRDYYDRIIRNTENSELIIVEDGSTDGSREILKGLQKSVFFTLLTADERGGYANAFKRGLQSAGSRYILFTDSDGQHDPGDYLSMLAGIEDCDIVSGFRNVRHDPIIRIILSRIFNFLIFVLFGLRVRDINSGFKLIKKKVIDTVLCEVTVLDYCVMSEFIVKAHLLGFKIKEIPVNHFWRMSGKTNIFHSRRLPFIIAKTMLGLLKIKVQGKPGSRK